MPLAVRIVIAFQLYKLSLLNHFKNIFCAIHVLVMVSRMEKSNLSIILSSVKSSSCSDTQSFSRYFLVYPYFSCVLVFYVDSIVFDTPFQFDGLGFEGFTRLIQGHRFGRFSWSCRTESPRKSTFLQNQTSSPVACFLHSHELFQ